MQRFQGDKQVEIYHMDYYKIKQYLSLQYRMIFFSFSFMLMPNPQGALQLAK